MVMAVGCATAPPPASQGALAAPTPLVQYTLTVQPRQATVEIDFEHLGANQIELSMPQWDGEPIWEDVYDLHAWVAGTDQRLPTKMVEPGRWQVDQIEGRDIRVRYVVVGRQGALSAATGAVSARRAYTGSEVFVGWGRGLFVVPSVPEARVEPWEELRLAVNTPEDWPVASTWGRKETGVRRARDLRDALLIAGDWRILPEEVQDADIQMAITGQWKSDEGLVRRQIWKMVAHHAKIFGGYPRNAAVAAIIPAAEPAVVAVPGGAVFFVPPDADLTTDQVRMRKLARDHLRLWTEELCHPRQHDIPGSPYRAGHLAWFTEGLTRYLGVRTLMGLGILEPREFLPMLNGWIKDYHSNPRAFDTSRPELVSGYDDNADFKKLAVAKGALLGLLLDVELRADSQGLKTLDILLRKMEQELGYNPHGYTNADILRLLSDATERPWGDFFQNFVDGTAPLPVEGLARGGIIVLELPFPVYDLGFDASQPELKGATITGVTGDSEAQRAGVRPGDVIKDIKFEPGRVNIPVKLRLKRPGKRRDVTVEFLPTRNIEMPVATEMTELFGDWFRR